ncbi:MAG: hypothetical protein ACJ8G7_25000 [Rhizobacter sp.]
MSGYRRAALALHALAPVDRRWLLCRLPGEQRERLAPLLRELDSLGARFDSADIGALTAADDGPRPPEIEPPLDPLGELDVDALTHAAAAEPDWVLAAVWHGATPVGRERLRQAVGASRAGALGDAHRPRNVALSAKVQEALIAALRRRASSGRGTGAGFAAAGAGGTPGAGEGQRRSEPQPSAAHGWRAWRT